MQHQVTQLINQQLKSLKLTNLPAWLVEQPANADHGDYACNVALVAFKALPDSAKQEHKNPRSFAQFLIDQLQQDLPVWLNKVELAGPGFINFWISEEELLSQAESFYNSDFQLPSNLKPVSKHIVVEFSSPNIAKPFTIGHLRSTIIGNSLANILEAVGHKVYRDNHLGDWGTQFGKLIYALHHLGEGSLQANIKKLNSLDFPVKFLVDLYIEFHKLADEDASLDDQGRSWFKKLEDGDKTARELWQMCIDWSWQEFSRIYTRLGVEFTENQGKGYGESYFEDKMKPVIQELKDKNLLTESRGAQLVFFDDETHLPPAMILKSDGATLYHTRDLATDKFRLQKYGKDITVINEVGAEQKQYFEQLYKIEELAGWYQPGQRIHVGHGLYSFKDGKMSTRKGNVIWLEEVLNTARDKAAQIIQNRQDIVDKELTAEKIGIGALIWNDLKRSYIHRITFDWDEILNLQGNSGPYLQYSYVRCQGVIEKFQADIAIPLRTLIDNKAYFEKNWQKEQLNILRNLYHYSEVVVKAAQELAPHHLATYLFELAQAFNAWYSKGQFVSSQLWQDQPDQVAKNILVVAATAQVLADGLQLLGIQTVDKM